MAQDIPQTVTTFVTAPKTIQHTSHCFFMGLLQMKQAGVFLNNVLESEGHMEVVESFFIVLYSEKSPVMSSYLIQFWEKREEDIGPSLCRSGILRIVRRKCDVEEAAKKGEI
jgi:hypothetical protein